MFLQRNLQQLAHLLQFVDLLARLGVLTGRTVRGVALCVWFAGKRGVSRASSQLRLLSWQVQRRYRIVLESTNRSSSQQIHQRELGSCLLFQSPDMMMKSHPICQQQACNQMLNLLENWKYTRHNCLTCWLKIISQGAELPIWQPKLHQSLTVLSADGHLFDLWQNSVVSIKSYSLHVQQHWAGRHQFCMK